jgi:hypothetical protein
MPRCGGRLLHRAAHQRRYIDRVNQALAKIMVSQEIKDAFEKLGDTSL